MIVDNSVLGKKEHCHWKLFIDGAARNNPGPAGAGIFLTSHDSVVLSRGFFLGDRTNNQAEYLALIIGLFFISTLVPHDEELCIVSDSLLLVKQMQGIYKVKNSELLRLQQVARALLSGYAPSFVHVRREFNKQADMLANSGIDNQVALPSEFITFMRGYDIIF